MVHITSIQNTRHPTELPPPLRELRQREQLLSDCPGLAIEQFQRLHLRSLVANGFWCQATRAGEALPKTPGPYNTMMANNFNIRFPEKHSSTQPQGARRALHLTWPGTDARTTHKNYSALTECVRAVESCSYQLLSHGLLSLSRDFSSEE